MANKIGLESFELNGVKFYKNTRTGNWCNEYGLCMPDDEVKKIKGDTNE